MTKLNFLCIAIAASISSVSLCTSNVGALTQIQSGALLPSFSVRANTDIDARGDIEKDEKNNGAIHASFKGDAEVKGDLGTTSGKELPPGISTAPGIEKRIEDGRGLPKGILSRLFGKNNNPQGTPNQERDTEVEGERNEFSTTTNDTVAPRIIGVRVDPEATTATIRWFTNERTSSEIQFAATSTVSGTTATTTTSASTGFMHRVTLEGLIPGTVYSYVIHATDQAGNVKETAPAQFTTDKEDTDNERVSPRVILTLALRVDADSARIIWVTNELARGTVYLGTEEKVSTTSPTATDTEFSFFHEAEFTGLTSGTRYFYSIESADREGNIHFSESHSFKTEVE